ncbi:hypothetical protein CBR_g12463 [Chara braunii]|uniref:Uncharacterized protein n=1 Tax=Chara braunii TaxID=69332 RepID=A0A388JSH1_CHABU|nr:hypothetical protein CBR_g12463 [Chara braunii]|eukprot:GBG60725.1 hypothetical protein CBR_g12463 [Chara braunii]
MWQHSPQKSLCLRLTTPVFEPLEDHSCGGFAPPPFQRGFRIDPRRSYVAAFVVAVGAAHLHSLACCVAPLIVSVVVVVAAEPAVSIVEAMCPDASVDVAAMFALAFVFHALVVAGSHIAGVASGFAAVGDHLAGTVAEDVVLVVPDADSACGVVVVLAMSAFACLTGVGNAAVSAFLGTTVAACATVPHEHVVLVVSVPPRIVSVEVVSFGLALATLYPSSGGAVASAVVFHVGALVVGHPVGVVVHVAVAFAVVGPGFAATIADSADPAIVGCARVVFAEPGGARGAVGGRRTVVAVIAALAPWAVMAGGGCGPSSSPWIVVERGGFHKACPRSCAYTDRRSFLGPTLGAKASGHGREQVTGHGGERGKGNYVTAEGAVKTLSHMLTGKQINCSIFNNGVFDETLTDEDEEVKGRLRVNSLAIKNKKILLLTEDEAEEVRAIPSEGEEEEEEEDPILEFFSRTAGTFDEPEEEGEEKDITQPQEENKGDTTLPFIFSPLAIIPQENTPRSYVPRTTSSVKRPRIDGLKLQVRGGENESGEGPDEIMGKDESLLLPSILLQVPSPQ